MKQSEKLLIIFLVILSIVGWGVFIYQYKEKKEITEVLMSQKDSLKMELTNLSNDYKGLQTNNQTLNDSIVSQQEKIIEVLEEVKKIKESNAKKIFQYKKEIETMRSIMKSYIRQIDELNQKNIKLQAENKKIKNKNTNLNKKFRSERKKNSMLDKKLKKASMLSIVDQRALAVKKHNKITEKASEAKAIRVHFKLPANSVAKKGLTNFYVRITMPDQLILSQSSADLFKFNGKKISYSAKKIIDYDGEVQDVTMFWTNPKKVKLIPGEYIVDIFTDGYELGTTTLTLEKSFSLFDW
jgi:cell division protein FtsL